VASNRPCRCGNGYWLAQRSENVAKMGRRRSGLPGTEPSSSSPSPSPSSSPGDDIISTDSAPCAEPPPAEVRGVGETVFAVSAARNGAAPVVSVARGGVARVLVGCRVGCDGTCCGRGSSATPAATVTTGSTHERACDGCTPGDTACSGERGACVGADVVARRLL